MHLPITDEKSLEQNSGARDTEDARNQPEDEQKTKKGPVKTKEIIGKL